MTADEIAAALNVAPSAIRIVEPDRFYKGMIEVKTGGRCISACITEAGIPAAVEAIKAMARCDGLDQIQLVIRSL